MNTRISFLSIVFLTMSVYAGAQTARNPLNHEPARIALQKGISSWKLSGETFCHADGTHIDKRFYAYDESGRKISNTNQRWNKSDGAWHNSLKNDYAYEENKSITISSAGSLTGWQNTKKIESVYNSDRKHIYSLTYLWDNNIDDWSLEPELRCEWVYDVNGRAVEYLKKRIDKETNEWSLLEARILYSYDEKGTLIEELYQSWDMYGESWISSGKYTYSKDSEMQEVAMSYFYASDKWIFDGKIVYLYDSEGKLIRSECYGNSQEGSLKAYSLYTYSENSCPVISETADINVYPNPVVSSFDLTVPEALVGKTANIFDVYGNFVKSVIVNSEKTQISVNGMSGGIYVLQIGDKTKKLVVK